MKPLDIGKCFLFLFSNIRSKDRPRRRTWAKTWQRIRDPIGSRAKDEAVALRRAWRRTARRRPLPTHARQAKPSQAKPSRIATGPRADIQNQRRCVWKQVDQPAVDGLGRYRLWLCRNAATRKR